MKLSKMTDDQLLAELGFCLAHKSAFNDAIKQGMSPDDYMFMYSHQGKHYFKHKVNRNYVSYKEL